MSEQHDCLAEGCFAVRCSDSTEPHGEEFSDSWLVCICGRQWTDADLRRAA